MDLRRYGEIPLKKSQKKSKAQVACEKHKKSILTGVMISIDPSSGGGSGRTHSDPAVCLWKEGRLVWRQSIEINGGHDIHLRLKALQEGLDEVLDPWDVDILIVEDVGQIRGKFTTMNKPLIWSVGCAIPVVKPKQGVIEVMPATWMRFVDKLTYAKSDINDATAIGWAAIQLAGETNNKLNLGEIDD